MKPVSNRVSILSCASLAFASALAFVGCATSKEPTYFALATAPRAGDSASSSSSAPALIELRRPGIAGYLDRADIVTKIKDHQLQIDSDQRWAEPLGDMIGRVVAQDLSSRLGGSQIFLESGAISAVPEVIVAMDVQTFDVGSDGQVTLATQVVIETPNGQTPPRAKRFELKGRPDSGSTSALVATMSTLLGSLSDGIAALLVQRPVAEVARKPSP